MIVTFGQRKQEYTALWASMSIRPENKSEIKATARQIVSGKARYEKVAAATGVPWYVVGIIHAMEAGLSFKTHLHNGDPLERNGSPAKTVQVPKGRGPFASWEESAIDAITLDGLGLMPDWSVERVAYAMESFNGFGSFRKGVPSAYLWSFTTAYSRGKYVKDGVWSATAVSSQPGAMALLRALIDANEIDDAYPRAELAAWPKAEATVSASAVKEGAKSKSVWALVTAGGAYVTEKTSALLGVLPDAVDDVKSQLDPVHSLLSVLKVNLGWVLGAVTVVGIVIALVRHANDKKTISQLKGDAQ